MSLGILGEYAKSLFASSPCTHKYFPRIRILCTANNPKLPYSPCTHKFFLRILRIRLGTFRLGTLKGQHFEKIEWGVIYVLAKDEQFKN